MRTLDAGPRLMNHFDSPFVAPACVVFSFFFFFFFICRERILSPSVCLTVCPILGSDRPYMFCAGLHFPRHLSLYLMARVFCSMWNVLVGFYLLVSVSAVA